MQAQLRQPIEIKGTRKRLVQIPPLFYVLPGYFLATLLFTYPLLLDAGRTVTDPVDPILNTWILAWGHHALLADPFNLLDANIFYPYDQALLYSETLLLPMAALLPIQVATGNPILTHNLLVWLGLASTAGCGYLLGRRLFRHHGAGLVVGLVLAFNSHSLDNLGQVQLVNIGWLPLSLLYTARLLHRPQLRNALLLALFLAAQFYTVIYYGIFGFLLVGVAGGVCWLLKRFPTWAARGQALGLLLAGLLAGLLLCLPLSLPYYALSRAQGLVRTLADTWPFSTSLEMWLLPPVQNLLYGAWGQAELQRLGFYTVATLFPGVILLVLAGAGLVLWLGERSGGQTSAVPRSGRNAGARYGLFLALGIGLFFLLSLGPYLQIRTLQPDFAQVLPYAWIHESIPGFQALRAPGRFAAIVFLGLAIAAAYMLTRLRWRSIQAVLLFLLFVENLSIPLPDLYTPAVGPADRQAFHRWLESQPPGTAYLELPLSSPGLDDQANRWLESQFASLDHWQPTPVGYSGFWPPRHDDLLLFVSRFPQQEAVHLLQALGVAWVFVDTGRLPADQWQAIEAAIEAHGWETQRWEQGLAVHLPRLSTVSPAVTYLIPDKAQAGGELTINAIFSAPQAMPVLPDSELGRLRAEWQQGDRRLLVVDKHYQPPFYVEPVAVAPVAIAVPDTAGLYTLSLYDHTGGLRATAGVTVAADVAPPETTLLPLHGLAATVACDADPVQLDIQMRTAGWYEQPFTLTARLLDEGEAELMRSAADVEFPAHRPRTNLHSIHSYTLPLAGIPAGAQTVEIIGYGWQQSAERIVPRHFVTADGAAVPALRLPLTVADTCGESSGASS